MEPRKQKEIKFYDAHAQKLAEKSAPRKKSDFEGFNPDQLLSFRFCYELLAKNCAGKKILDYGCGNGLHAPFLARLGNEVVGIDLSNFSLRIAEERARHENIAHKTTFMEMDCEKLEFSDNSFDVIFDGGTFSSIDIQKAFPELARILNPGGALIGIETYGHNPLANLNRALNVRSGKRTAWAAAHIFNDAGLTLAKKYFGKVEILHFHLFSWVLFPFAGKAWGKRMLDLIEPADGLFLKLPFFKKYAFKVVFKFSEPIK